MDSLKGLKIIHLNIRSLKNKIDLLRPWVEQHKPMVITLSETWLTDKISNNEIKLTNYRIYRADRGSRCGGVVTYVSADLASELIVPTVEPVHFESIFVKVILHENKYITIGNIYRPPSAPAVSFNCIVSTINSIHEKNELVILGDFNRCWLDKASKNAKHIIGNLNLTQLINEPTRVTPTCQSLLDWILVSHPNRIIKSGITSDCFSDHCMVFCIWKIKLPKLPPKLIKIRQDKKINVDEFINDLILVNWDRYQIISNVHEAWSFFHSELTRIIDKHAPFKTIKVRGSHLPWITSDLLSSFRQRDKAWALYRMTKDRAHWESYRLLRNKCKTLTRNAKSNYYKESLNHDFKNSKQFWKKIKTITNSSDKNTHCNQLKANNTILHNPLLIAQAFNNHFSSVCSPTMPDPYVIYNNSPPCHSSFSFRKISPLDVLNTINELKVGSGPGLDGIESKFLKLAPHILMFPLCDLFNLSLSTHEIPSIWKYSQITPLHKAGNTLDPNNYRPISIICSIAKIFEKLIYNQLSNYLNINNILSPFQSGFRSNHSTTTALVKLTNDIYSASGNSNLTGAVFIDLSKAFDLVNHYLLLDKLYAIGLSRNALLWFNSYLHYRKQCVVIQDNKSDLAVQERGVPQGSTLGPLLFSIFINDLPSIFSNCNVQLYADDTVIYTSQSTLPLIQSTLQSNFNQLEAWLSANKLLINKTKTNTMLFGTKQNLASKTINESINITCLDGTHLHRVEQIKYLGLWLDSELNYKCHIDNIVRKINFSTGVLYRNRKCFTFTVRKKLVQHLILPIMDYADIVYQTAPKTNLLPINTLFNRLCRFTLDCPYLTHHCTMYEDLNFLSPTARRQQHWLQFIFKCIHFNYPQYLKQYMDPFTSNHHLRHCVQIYFKVPSNVSNSAGKESFRFKAPTAWNNLPVQI